MKGSDSMNSKKFIPVLSEEQLEVIKKEMCSDVWDAINSVSSLSAPWDFEQFLLNKCPRKYWVKTGASKICVVSRNKAVNFVIKFSYGDDMGEVDEAIQEAEIYADAKVKGLDMFFPKTEIMENPSCYKRIVYQERVEDTVNSIGEQEYNQYYRMTKTVTDKIVNKVIREFLKGCTNGRNSRHADEMWVKMALSIYGKKIVKSLCNFVIEHEINDLHCNNLGYLHDRPVFLDFSGFYR